MNELAIFAGAGFGLLATTSLGFKTVCAIELDWYSRCVLVQRQNDGIFRPFPIWDDVRTFDGRPWRGRVDFVSGGFPCQPYSKAAAGKNNSPDLWPEMLRVVADVDPGYVFAENVSKESIECAAEDLVEMGYKAEMLSLSAKDLGADHIRERFWLLAYSDDKSKLQREINAKMEVLPEFCEGVWWSKPAESGMDNGRPSRMDRYRAIGNGQIPVVATAALWELANSG